MAKVYSGIEGIEAPEYKSGEKFEDLEKREEDYVESIKLYCKIKGSGKLRGEEVRVGYADGCARYVVFKSSPLSFIHLKVGDAWDSPYIRMFKLKDVKDYIFSN